MCKIYFFFILSSSQKTSTCIISSNRKLFNISAICTLYIHRYNNNLLCTVKMCIMNQVLLKYIVQNRPSCSSRKNSLYFENYICSHENMKKCPPSLLQRSTIRKHVPFQKLTLFCSKKSLQFKLVCMTIGSLILLPEKTVQLGG